MNRILILPILVLFLTACSQEVWERTSNGVLIHPTSKKESGAKTIGLEVLSDQIIRVVASPSNEILKTKSLCVIDSAAKKVTFEVAELNDSIVVSTAKLKAKVSMATGDVKFYDENNKLILQERSAAKSFSPITVEGTNGYSFSQVFESPADEAFYGLGQHQSDEFNYKGRNESL